LPKPTKNDPLTEMRLDIMACAKCRLCHDRQQAVPGVGTMKAKIVLVGEAPGYNEDKTGNAFCGKSGTRLNKWLAQAGLSRDDLFITSVLKCHPPRNRFPSDDIPADACMPWLIRQLKAIQPLAVILCGKKALHYVAMRTALGMADPISPHVGKIMRRRDLYGEVRFGVIYHPAFILRSGNPWDEEKCITTLTTIAEYVREVSEGRPAPMIEIEDLRPAKPVQHQQRMRLFPEAPDA
jgi:DNA polymerase